MKNEIKMKTTNLTQQTILAGNTDTPSLRRIKIWVAKFSLGRRSQDSKEGEANVAWGEEGAKICLLLEADYVTWQKGQKKTRIKNLK